MEREVEGISEGVYYTQYVVTPAALTQAQPGSLKVGKRDTPRAFHTFLGCPSMQKELTEAEIGTGCHTAGGYLWPLKSALAPFCRVSVTSFLTPENRTSTEPPEPPTAMG